MAEAGVVICDYDAVDATPVEAVQRGIAMLENSDELFEVDNPGGKNEDRKGYRTVYCDQSDHQHGNSVGSIWIQTWVGWFFLLTYIICVGMIN